MKKSKKLFSVLTILLIVSVISAVFSGMVASASTVALYGDANSDTAFDIRDLVCLKKYEAGNSTSINLPAVHVTAGSGTDLVIMKKALIGVQSYAEYLATADYFLFKHGTVLSKNTSNISEDDEAAVTSALSDWGLLSAEAKDATAAQKSLLDSLSEEIHKIQASGGEYFPGNW